MIKRFFSILLVLVIAGFTHGNSQVLWTPLNLGSLVEWWDASNTLKITLNGSSVASWAGTKSGTVVSQGTTADQPGYSAVAMNGAPGLTYSGFPPQELISQSTLSQGGSWSMMAVTLPTANAALNSVVDGDNGTTRVAQYLRNSSNVLQAIAFTSSTNFTASGGSITNSAVNLEYSQYDGTTLTAYVDATAGTPVTTSGSPITGSVQFGIGNRSTSLFQPFFGAMGDVVWCNSMLSISQRQKLEGYEAWKYNAASVLPNGHPYKLRPPYVSDP